MTHRAIVSQTPLSTINLLQQLLRGGFQLQDVECWRQNTTSGKLQARLRASFTHEKYGRGVQSHGPLLPLLSILTKKSFLVSVYYHMPTDHVVIKLSDPRTLPQSRAESDAVLAMMPASLTIYGQQLTIKI